MIYRYVVLFLLVGAVIVGYPPHTASAQDCVECFGFENTNPELEGEWVVLFGEECESIASEDCVECSLPGGASCAGTWDTFDENACEFGDCGPSPHLVQSTMDALGSDELEVVASILASHRERVVWNRQRGSLQFMTCTGKVFVNLPIGDRAAVRLAEGFVQASTSL